MTQQFTTSKLLLPAFLLLAACISQNSKHEKNNTDTITLQPVTTEVSFPANAITGDFNGDGKQEHAWLVAPELNKDSTDCTGDCTSYIRFSDSAVAAIKIEHCINGDPVNLGDLNKNSTDEIGFLPGSLIGCWNDYHVYTFKTGKWTDAVKPFPVHCNQWDEGMPPVKADSAKKGYVIITYSINKEAGIVTKTKSVPVL